MRILSWLRRPPVDLDEDDFKDEIRAHLAIAANEKASDGTDSRDARYAALKEFGNVTLTTEAARRVWTPWWLEALRDLTSDVRYAVRSLAKNKAFSLTVIGVLALGIGSNAAVFTMLKGIALAPLAGVDGSGRLAVVVRETIARRPLRVSYPDYQYLRDHDQAFSGLLGTAVSPVGLGRDRNSRSLFGEIVTGNYFQVLGVRAQIGRTLLPSDEIAPGRHPVVVISDGLWRRDFGADPGVVGQSTYGLVSFTVKQSTHEIGIRMALGAPRLSVVRGFLVRGLRLGAIGAGIWTVSALALSRFLQGALFGVSATDSTSFVTALAIVLGGVVVATLVPAWRAARTDPLRALRHQ